MMTRLVSSRRSSFGFSLTELLVAMVISVGTLLILMVSVSGFEGGKRNATGNVDADQNANIGMHLLAGDIRQGGAGLATTAGLACTSYLDGNGTINSMLPVQIVAGSINFDQIIVNYSTSAAGGVPVGLVLAAPTPPANVLQVQTPSSSNINAGDLALLSTPGSSNPCTLVQVSTVTQNLSSTQIQIAAYPSGQTLAFPAGVTYDISPQSYVVDMGTFAKNMYQVICNSLVVSNPITGTGAPSCTINPPRFTSGTVLADNIVALRAQYGIAPSGSQTVNCWVNATNGGNACDAGDWSAPTPTNVARIKAVRLAIVARSYQPDPHHVEPNCTNASGGVNHGPCLWRDSAANPAPVIDLSATSGWQNYRYRVVSTIVPLKNVLWATL
jgi:type IV pilus assembly protein PilW